MELRLSCSCSALSHVDQDNNKLHQRAIDINNSRNNYHHQRQLGGSPQHLPPHLNLPTQTCHQTNHCILACELQVELIGANILANASREQMSYTIDCLGVHTPQVSTFKRACCRQLVQCKH